MKASVFLSLILLSNLGLAGGGGGGTYRVISECSGSVVNGPRIGQEINVAVYQKEETGFITGTVKIDGDHQGHHSFKELVFKNVSDLHHGGKMLSLSCESRYAQSQGKCFTFSYFVYPDMPHTVRFRISEKTNGKTMHSESDNLKCVPKIDFP